MKYHFCTEQPCKLETKELLDLFNLLFTTEDIMKNETPEQRTAVSPISSNEK